MHKEESPKTCHSRIHRNTFPGVNVGEFVGQDLGSSFVPS